MEATIIPDMIPIPQHHQYYPSNHLQVQLDLLGASQNNSKTRPCHTEHLSKFLLPLQGKHFQAVNFAITSHHKLERAKTTWDVI